MGVGSRGCQASVPDQGVLMPASHPPPAASPTPCPFPLPQSPMLWLDGAEMPIKGICQCYHWRCPGKTPFADDAGPREG